MVTTDVELQLMQQLKEAGRQLSHPPASVDELLHLLDQTEKLLSMVDQSPNTSMLEAFSPSKKALVDESLLKHSNVDVKVAVAACLCEITRITAPDIPYNDEEMQGAFQLIVSSFENLSDNSSRSYSKRVSILDNVSKVRSCVILLDLEREDLIVEMFELFLKSIRDHHGDSIFSSMMNIIAIILEEIEDISVNMLKPLLTSIKNNREGVLPVARKLGEGVLQRSAAKLKPYLIKTLSILGDSLDDYSQVLASICEGTTNVVEHNDETTSVHREANDSKLTMSSSDNTAQVVIGNAETDTTFDTSLTLVNCNGRKVTGNEGGSTDNESKKQEEAIEHPDYNPISKAGTNDSVAEKSGKVESKSEETSDTTLKSAEPSDSSHGHGKNEDDKNTDILKAIESEVAIAPEERGSLPDGIYAKKDDLSKEADKNTDTPVSIPKAIESEVAIAPAESASLPDESYAKKEDLSKEADKNTDIPVSIPKAIESEVAIAPAESASLMDESYAKEDLSKEADKKADILVSIPKAIESEVAIAPAESGSLPDESYAKKDDLSKEADKNTDIPVSIPKAIESEVTIAPAESGSLPDESYDMKVGLSKEADKNTDIPVSIPKAIESEVTIAPAESGSLPDESYDKKVDLSNEADKNTDISVSILKVIESAVTIAPTKSGSLLDDLSKEGGAANLGTGFRSRRTPCKRRTKRVGWSKKKSLNQDDAPSTDKTPEGMSDSDMKSSKRARMNAQEDKVKLPATIATVEESKATSDSDAKHLKTSSKKMAIVNSVSKTGKRSGKKVGARVSAAKKPKLSGKKTDAGDSVADEPKQADNKDDENDSDVKPLNKEERSDSDTKPLKLSAKKGYKSSSAPVKSSSKNKDGIKHRSGKNVEVKDQAESLPEDDGMDVSPKSLVKTGTEKGNPDPEEVLATYSRRKRAIRKDKVSKTIKYDDSLVGLKVKVWWPKDKMYYEGDIDSFDSVKNKHKVSYVDGDEEILNLRKEKWEILQEFSAHIEEKAVELQNTDDFRESPKSRKNSGPSDSQEKSKFKPKSISLDVKESEDADAAETSENPKEKPAEKTTKTGSKSGKKRKKRT